MRTCEEGVFVRGGKQATVCEKVSAEGVPGSKGQVCVCVRASACASVRVPACV